MGVRIVKFIIYFSLLIIYSGVSVHAQVGQPRTDLAVGINGGFVMNRVTFNPAVKQSFKNGLTMGVTARYTCEKYFSMLCAFQAEINYSQAGWKENPSSEEAPYQRNIHYVQMPLFANLGFGRERGGVKGFLVIGPQLGYCISESVREGARFLTPQVLVGDLTQHDLKVQKKFEYGIAGGLGMDVSTKKGHHFIIEGRYFFGLSDIFSSTKKDPFGRSANSTISAKVSYLFDIIKTKQ